MIELVVKILYAFFKPIKAFRKGATELVISLILLWYCFYLLYIYSSEIYEKVYEPVIYYCSPLFWNEWKTVLILSLSFYVFRAFIVKYYIKTEKSDKNSDKLIESSAISLNRRILERRTYVASSSVSNYVVDNCFDRRFLISPFGTLSQRKVRTNYLIKMLKNKIKVELWRYFFDFEYAASFKGIFKWWFLNWQVLFNFTAFLLSGFFLFGYYIGSNITDEFAKFIFTHYKKKGLYFGSFKLIFIFLSVFKVVFYGFIFTIIAHVCDKSKRKTWNQFYRQKKGFFRLGVAEFLVSFMVPHAILVFFAKNNKFAHLTWNDLLALRKIRYILKFPKRRVQHVWLVRVLKLKSFGNKIKPKLYFYMKTLVWRLIDWRNYYLLRFNRKVGKKIFKPIYRTRVYKVKGVFDKTMKFNYLYDRRRRRFISNPRKTSIYDIWKRFNTHKIPFYQKRIRKRYKVIRKFWKKKRKSKIKKKKKLLKKKARRRNKREVAKIYFKNTARWDRPAQKFSKLSYIDNLFKNKYVGSRLIKDSKTAFKNSDITNWAVYKAYMFNNRYIHNDFSSNKWHVKTKFDLLAEKKTSGYQKGGKWKRKQKESSGPRIFTVNHPTTGNKSMDSSRYSGYIADSVKHPALNFREKVHRVKGKIADMMWDYHTKFWIGSDEFFWKFVRRLSFWAGSLFTTISRYIKTKQDYLNDLFFYFVKRSFIKVFNKSLNSSDSILDETALSIVRPSNSRIRFNQVIFDKIVAEKEFINFVENDCFGLFTKALKKADGDYFYGLDKNLLKNIFIQSGCNIKAFKKKLKFHADYFAKKNNLETFYQDRIKEAGDPSKDFYSLLKDVVKIDLYLNSSYFRKLVKTPSPGSEFTEENLNRVFNPNLWLKIFITKVLDLGEDSYVNFRDNFAKESIYLSRKLYTGWKINKGTKKTTKEKKDEETTKKSQQKNSLLWELFVAEKPITPPKVTALIKLMLYKKSLEFLKDEKQGKRW